jgi:hypothetical protein
MNISSHNGNSFQLKIIGYEFPEMENEEWDSNWLRICMAANLPHGEWSVTQPFLLTYEVMRLANWFDAVSTGTQAENEIHFVEPNLSFELIDLNRREASLRIYFAMECLPPRAQLELDIPWAQGSEQAKADVYTDFPLSDIDLHAAAESLRSQLKLYPQRAEQYRLT